MEKEDLERPLVPQNINTDNERSENDARYLNNNEYMVTDLTINSDVPAYNRDSEVTSDNDANNSQDEEDDDDDADYEDYVRTVTRVDKQSIIGEALQWRKIKVNENNDLNAPENTFLSNEIHTSKYSILTFIPK
jgi:hypothetical protein